MESKLITNYPINLKRKTPFSGSCRLVNLSILLAAVFFLFPACNRSEQVSQTIVQPEDTTEQLPEGQGLAIGAMAPEFSLIDAKGNTHTLSDYSGQKLVIVFYRTGT